MCLRKRTKQEVSGAPGQRAGLGKTVAMCDVVARSGEPRREPISGVSANKVGSQIAGRRRRQKRPGAIASPVARELTQEHIPQYTDNEVGIARPRGVITPTLLAADTAGKCRFSVLWPGGGVICPSLAAKKRRAVS